MVLNQAKSIAPKREENSEIEVEIRRDLSTYLSELGICPKCKSSSINIQFAYILNEQHGIACECWTCNTEFKIEMDIIIKNYKL